MEYLLPVTHIKVVQEGIEKVYPITSNDKIVYSYILHIYNRLRSYKRRVRLTHERVSANTGCSVSTVRRSVSLFKKAGVFKCDKLGYNNQGKYNPMVYNTVIDLSRDTSIKCYSEKLVQWNRKRFKAVIDESKASLLHKKKKPSEWRIYRRNVAYEIERGVYYTEEERALIWSINLAPNGVKFSWLY